MGHSAGGAVVKSVVSVRTDTLFPMLLRTVATFAWKSLATNGFESSKKAMQGSR